MDGAERFLLPDCVVISRETGQVERVEYSEGTQDDAARMGRILLKLAEMGKKLMEEEASA